ncbi:MAG: hypothetical protein IT370_37360 [Deltaproteobacteria bacterium]|nr:hypothetical protein [Deltaproteobacteria bacterium]
MRALWLGVVGVSLALTGVANASGTTPPEPDIKLPLVVHVLHGDGVPIASADDIDAMVSVVNRIYADAGICFGVTEVREHAQSADFTTYRERRALKKFVVARAINIFLLRTIKDPSASESTLRALARVNRAPSGWLRGAEIPAKGKRPDVYLLVKLDAGAPTLAHELGHFLGAGHHADPDNLMSYGSGRAWFDARQHRSFRAAARRQLRARTLAPARTCVE